jgi:hypothetical protein
MLDPNPGGVTLETFWGYAVSTPRRISGFRTQRLSPAPRGCAHANRHRPPQSAERGIPGDPDQTDARSAGCEECASAPSPRGPISAPGPPIAPDQELEDTHHKTEGERLPGRNPQSWQVADSRQRRLLRLSPTQGRPRDPADADFLPRASSASSELVPSSSALSARHGGLELGAFLAKLALRRDETAPGVGPRSWGVTSLRQSWGAAPEPGV